MHARQTTVQGDPANVDRAIETIRSEVLPALEGADGFKGFTLLVDRESGTLIGTSYFESAEAVQASEDAVRATRAAAASAAGGGEPQVRFFEVAIDAEA